MGYSKLRMVWNDMKRRCDNPNRIAYKDYGGRGIKICTEWYNYETFKLWALNNGYSEKLFLDRKDNNGDYEPKNCRFVNRFESELNKRRNGFNNIRLKRDSFEVSMRRYGTYFYIGSFHDIYEAMARRDEFELKLDIFKRNILNSYDRKENC